MSERELSIKMKLIDEVTKSLNNIEGGLQKFANSARSVAKDLKQFGRDISQVGKTIAAVGASITGPMVLAFNSASKYSVDVKREINNLNAVMNTFQVTIGQALAPIMRQLNSILLNLLNAWNRLSSQQQQLIIQSVFMTGVFTTLIGVVGALIGKMMLFASSIASVASRLITLSVAHPYLTAILILISLITAAMWKWKGVTDIVLNTLELMFKNLLTTLEFIWQAFLKIQEGLAKIIALVVSLGSLLPKKLGGEFFQNMADKVWTFADECDRAFGESARRANKNLTDMDKILSGHQGEWAKGFDEMKEKVSGLFSGIEIPNLDDQIAALQDQLNTSAGSTLVQDYLTQQESALAQSRAMWQAWHDEKTAAALSAIQRENEFLTLALDSQQKAHQSMWTAVSKMRDTFSQGMTTLVMEMIQGTKSATEFFRSLGLQMVKILVDWMIQKTVNFALSKVMQSMEVAIAKVTGAAIAAAWAPAAAMVSLATMGSNSTAAIAGMTTTVATAQALAIPKAEYGATIRGSQYGSLVIAGENYKQENIVPLDKSQSGGKNVIVNVEIVHHNSVFLQEEAMHEFYQKAAREVSGIISDEIGRG